MLTPGQTYFFKVRAGNSCGKGPFSDSFNVKFGGIIERKMDPVQLLMERAECAVRFDWTPTTD